MNNNHTSMVLHFSVSEKSVVPSTICFWVVLGTGATLSKREQRKRSESLFLCAECRGFLSSALAQRLGVATKLKKPRAHMRGAVANEGHHKVAMPVPKRIRADEFVAMRTLNGGVR